MSVIYNCTYSANRDLAVNTVKQRVAVVQHVVLDQIGALAGIITSSLAVP